jgi:hypothetical protein
MLYIHENNLLNKISSNYKGHGSKIKEFYDKKYLPIRGMLESLVFTETDREAFKKAAKIINDYYKEIDEFSHKYSITSQSKFASTFLEEISTYLFKDLPEIKSGEFGVFNKRVYAGLKIDKDKKIGLITKDVDFCIGKKVNFSIDGQPSTELILPVVAVEVKTYLDATMFGEIKSSSKAIRSASPNSKTYVLMGYKCIADEHIIAARQDSTLSEMFVLRRNEYSPIDSEALYLYWHEIVEAIADIAKEDTISVPGKLLR